jgi:hypothetical protein
VGSGRTAGAITQTQTGAVSGAQLETVGPSGGAVSTPGPPITSSTSGVSTPGAAGSAIPATGPGWDKAKVYVGVATQTVIASVGHTLGSQALDYGDQKAQWQALFAYYNKRGGLFGRQMVPVYYDNDPTKNADQTAAEACARWTQDQRVVAALVTIPGLGDSIMQCLKSKQLPGISTSYTPHVNADLKPFFPYIAELNAVDFDRLVDPWIAALKANGYFTGWDSTRGVAGVEPVRIGLLHADTPTIDRAFALLGKHLTAAGYTVVDNLTYSGAPDSSQAVKFRSDRVTHVFPDNLGGFLFPQAAESQGYRPRYGVSTQNLTYAFMQETAPKAQLNGLVGAGWQPTSDVDQEHDTGSNPAADSCLKAMHDEGIDTSKRNYKEVLLTNCDAMRLMLSAAGIARSLTGSAIASALSAALSRFQSGLIPFGLTSQSHIPNVVDAFRAIKWDLSCSCVEYVKSPTYSLG